jgi:pimeloyl-ACP methyl ester carboxylesterase
MRGGWGDGGYMGERRSPQLEGPSVMVGHLRARLVAGALVAVWLVGCTGPTGSVSGPAATSGSPDAAAIVGEIPSKWVTQSGPSLTAAVEYGLADDEAQYNEISEFAASLPWRHIRAGGVVQAAACTGSGVPTVVYSSGSGDSSVANSSAWVLARTASAQAAVSRVCLFDRPGVGFSGPRPEGGAPNGPVANATELTALMQALNEPGPFVLVGWSYGGLVARTVSAQEPNTVAGLVLVDASSPGQVAAFDLAPSQLSEGGVAQDWEAADRVIADGATMGSKPVVVLRAGKHEGGSAKLWKWWKQAQAETAASISDNSVLGVVPESDHEIPLQAPEAVVAATNAVIESVTTGQVLPICPTDFAEAGITC